MPVSGSIRMKGMREWEIIRMKRVTQNDVLESVVSITSKVTRRRLRRSQDVEDKHFSAMGVDSINVFEIILALEQQFEVSLDDEFLFENSTPAKAADALLGKLSNQA